MEIEKETTPEENINRPFDVAGEERFCEGVRVSNNGVRDRVIMVRKNDFPDGVIRVRKNEFVTEMRERRRS
jgi:hypothetical protein